MQYPFTEATDPIKHTTQPIVTGASVLALKYKDGVMMISDTLGSYGGLAMFKKLQRVHPVTRSCLLGAGGEYSDYQYILKLLQQLTTEDFVHGDGAHLTPQAIHSYLTRVLYNRRSKIDPLWNQLIVGGYENGLSFLGAVDLYGSSYMADVLATGYGQHLAIPLLRKHHRPDMTYEEAKGLLEDCERVLLYRDCRTLNRFHLSTVSARGCEVSEPYSISTNWSFQRFINPHDST